MASTPPAFLVGISGLSSSGKTTLSRLLRLIFRSSFILHQDDFYLPDSAIPVRSKNRLKDWDCVESINWAHMSRVLDFIHATGALPKDLNSLQDESPVGNTDDLVALEFVERMRAKVLEAELGDVGRVAIVDGFLLFHEGGPVEERIDAKILLRVPYAMAKQRREERAGYVTIEGFWTDPLGYFDEIVWPNYVKEHKYLFVDGNVEGQLKPEVEEQRRIHTPQALDVSTEGILEWAVDILIHELKGQKPNTAK